MSTFKKLLALSLALAMVLSFSAFAADYKNDTYKDAANIDKDCADAVELMYALDIMKGDQNSNFNPTGTITRAEIAKMIYVVLNKGNDDQAVNFKYNQMFSDVSGDAWYAGYVNYCAATKLIDGYNGKFLPLQPVSTAQAAKMLLTAIGYSSEDRNYTGANWEKNVLADAAVVGLLNDYNWPTNQSAPRQWVAVMFQNMLLDAYTYNTARPGTINGLITGNMGEVWNQPITMGEKYFGLEDETYYLYGLKNSYIEEVLMEDGKTKRTTSGGTNRAVFADGDAEDGIVVRNVKQGYMDLGQQYRVIFKDTGSYYTAYSVRPTGKSVVADAMLKDMKSEVNRKTSSNDAANKYIFTIGDMEAAFTAKTIKTLVLNERTYSKDDDDSAPDASALCGTMTPVQLDKVVGDLKTDDYRAIDRDGDGDIDYLIIKEYTYGQVTKVGTHRDYGEYFNAITPNKGNASGTKDYTMNGYGSKNVTNWYIEDVVSCETEIEKNNAIKVCYNPDKDLYDVEVLPVETGDYTKRTQDQKKAHTIGGEEYFAATDGFENPYINLVSKNLKEELAFAYDDNLVVLVGQEDSNYTDIDDINAQLVMVMNAYVDVYSNGNNRLYIDYMTIDGETHEEVRYSQGRDYQDFYDMLDNGTRVGNALNTDVKVDANGNLENSRELLLKHQRLFKLVEHDDNTVSLIKLTPDDVDSTHNSQSQLDYADTLLTDYREDTDELNTDNNKFGSDYVNASNKFFVSFLDEDGEDQLHHGGVGFAVMTLDEMGEGKDPDAFIQGLYYNRRTTDTYLAGHIFYGLDLSNANGYLYTTDDGAFEIDEDEWYLDGVTFANGTQAEEPIRVTKVDNDGKGLKDVVDEDDILPNKLYSYTYQKSNGTVKYQLTLIDETKLNNVDTADTFYRFDFSYDDEAGIYEPDNNQHNAAAKIGADSNFDPIIGTGLAEHDYELVDALSNRYFSGKGAVDGDDTDIKRFPSSGAYVALKTVTLDRDETQEHGWGDDKTYGFKVSEKIEFMSYADLIEEEDDVSVNNIYDNDEWQNNDTYTYYTDYYFEYDSDGDVCILYVVVYEVMVEANW